MGNFRDRQLLIRSYLLVCCTFSGIAYLQGCQSAPSSSIAVSQPTTPLASPQPPAELTSESAPVTVGQRTYHIGNSLTDTINSLLEPIAKSAGYQHEYLRSTIPGAPTDWNWDHPGQAMGEPDYRVVFATKAPIDHLFTQPYAGHNRSIDNEVEYSGRFYRLARQKSPQVQFWIYAQWPNRNFNDPWAKADGSAAGLGLKPATTWAEAVMNHLAYHEAVRQRLDDLNDGKPIRIVPAGLALVRLQEAIAAGRIPQTKEFFDTHFEDTAHLNNRGAYMVALVHYACIYRRSPVGVSFEGSGLTAEQATLYQQIAWDTVRTYPWSGVRQ